MNNNQKQLENWKNVLLNSYTRPSNLINGIFITEDQAYDNACKSEFLAAKPYNLAISQMHEKWNCRRSEELYTPTIEFKVANLRTGRNKKFWTSDGIVWSKGIVGWVSVKTIMDGATFTDYDVRSSLIKLGVA